MLKKSTVVTISLFAIFLSACSVDQRYKREVNGNNDYLDTPALQKLNMPEGTKLPIELGDYYVYQAAKEGAVGDDIDIRPPLLPAATISGSYAYYDGKAAILEVPTAIAIWNKVPAILNANSIPIASNTNQEIRTVSTAFPRADEDIAREASYLIRHTQTGVRQVMSVELLTLQANGESLLNNAIEKQRYTVDFFNMLMLQLLEDDKVEVQQ